MWTGKPYRSKQAILATGTHASVKRIIIHDDGIEIMPGTLAVHFISERKKCMIDHFATSDGFKDWQEMKAFFYKVHGLPFEGRLIEWKLI